LKAVENCLLAIARIAFYQHHMDLPEVLQERVEAMVGSSKGREEAKAGVIGDEPHTGEIGSRSNFADNQSEFSEALLSQPGGERLQGNKLVRKILRDSFFR
jgi:hypothetical protein